MFDYGLVGKKPAPQKNSLEDELRRNCGVALAWRALLVPRARIAQKTKITHSTDSTKQAEAREKRANEISWGIFAGLP